MSEILSNVVQTVAQGGSMLINTIDPNWFFSSVAQCSAAIVGLMGAFLITKLITQKSVIKNIETQIEDYKTKVSFLSEKIKDKEDWIKQVDEEENLNNIKKFLEELSDSIDVTAPPTIDELIKTANESKYEDFHNLDRQLLEKCYNEEYLNGAREKQRSSELPLGLGSLIPQFNFSSLYPQIEGAKWDRYRRYSEEINNVHLEQKYTDGILNSKKNELLIEKAGADIKKTFFYLFFFSIVGVFLPLTIMLFDLESMYFLRIITIIAVAVAWGIILWHLYSEIKGIGNKS